MGSYNNAVITNQGLDYIAQALAGEITLTFSHMAISDYAYPAGTNLAALTSLQSVKMTVVPASVWVQDTTVGVRGMFSNTTVTTEYPINTVGVYATNGTTEILFSVSIATSPDIMEPYNGVAPSSFIFTVQETINEASSLNITVSEAGMATAQDIADLQEQKQDVITGAASTITEDNLAASRALASDASGKVVASPVTATELGYLDGVTSNLQTQLNGKQASITGGASTIATTNLTVSRALVSNSTGKVAVSSVTATELGRLAGITGNVQEQINSLKTQTVTTAGTNLNNYTEQGIYYFANTVTPTNIPAGVNGYLIVLPSGTGVVRQIWLRSGTTNTNDYMVWERTNYLNSSATEWGNWVRFLTSEDTLLSGAASTIEKNDLTASRALVSNTAGKVAVSAVTSTELGYLDGVTSNVQTQINGKQATITGGASTIAANNLTASRALISNGSGKVAVSAVTSTELGYLSGLTGNVQNQLNTFSWHAVTTASTSLDNYHTPGWYYFSETYAPTNPPEGNGGTLLVLSYYKQVWFRHGTPNVNDWGMFTRMAVDESTWGSWTRYLTQKDLPDLTQNAAGVNNLSVTSGTATNAGTIELTPGTWIVSVSAYWQANSNGNRSVWASITSEGNSWANMSMATQRAVNGDVTVQQFTFMLTITSNRTYYIVVKQDSGSSVNVSTRYNIMKMSGEG